MSQDKKKKRPISIDEAIKILQPDCMKDAGDIEIIPDVLLTGISPAELARKKSPESEATKKEKKP
jgi:hypothetical protein